MFKSFKDYYFLNKNKINKMYSFRFITKQLGIPSRVRFTSSYYQFIGKPLGNSKNDFFKVLTVFNFGYNILLC